MSRFLAMVATLIIILLAAGLAAPYLVNWNDYRGVFEAQATKLIGRQVRVGGKVDLNVLPTPSIRFDDVQIASADGRFNEPFAEVRSFRMVLSLGPLLSGAIEANRVELIDPIFRLRVDKSGASNWSSLGPQDAQALIMAPREVTLKNVEITGGLVEIRTPHDPAPFSIDGLTGQFEANALSGPFKFAGVAIIRGRPRELRLATGRVENGAAKLRMSVRSAEGADDYLLDGDVTGLDGSLSYRGPLTAHFGVARSRLPAASAPEGGDDIEFKSQTHFSLAEASLDDITLTVVKQNRPQTLTGKARAEWGAKSRLEVSLHTRWLELEPFLGASEPGRRAPALVAPPPGAASQRPSIDSVAALLPRFLGALPFSPREGTLKVEAEQLGFGGDSIENLSLELAKDGVTDKDARGKDAGARSVAAWRIAAARAKLPGDSQVSLTGALRNPGDGYEFAGAVDASGASLVKLLRWIAPDYEWAEEGEAQRYALRGQVEAGPKGAAIASASGELGGSSFTGSVRYERPQPGAAAGKLGVAGESSRLDLRPLFPGEKNLSALVNGETAEAKEASITGAEPDGEGANGAGHVGEGANGAGHGGKGLWEAFTRGVAANDSDIDLRTGVLLLPGFEGRNVAAKLLIREGAIDIKKLTVSGDGLAVRADGRLERYRENPEGALRLAIDAERGASLKTLALLFGAPEAVTANERRLDALAPLHMEGSFSAARGAGRADLKLNGAAGASALSLTGLIATKGSSIWNGAISVAASVNNPVGADLLRQIAPPNIQSAYTNLYGGRTAGPGSLNIKAEGSLKGLVEVNADLKSAALEARFAGKIAPHTDPWTMDGRLAVKAQDAAAPLAMLDLAQPDSAFHGSLELNGAMTKSGARYELASATLHIEGVRVDGGGSVDLGGEAPAVTVKAAADSVSAPRLFGMLVETGAANGAAPASGPWPDRPFAFKAFDAVEGALTLKAQRIDLGGGASLEEGQIEAKLEKGALRLGKLAGKLWGGHFKADGELTAHAPTKTANAEGGASLLRHATLKANLSIERADLKRLPPAADGRPLARGMADLQLSFAGEGVSPRGLVAVLHGGGTLRLDRGALYGVAPQAIGRAARAYLDAPKRPEGGMARLIAEQFRGGVFPYRAAQAPVTIANGVLQIKPALLYSTRGAARVSALLDLSSMRVDSEWELRAAAPRVRKYAVKPETWPPLKLVVAGPLAQFGALPQQVEADEYERGLTMRKMERDVERLENLTPPGPGPSAPPGRVQNDGPEAQTVAGDQTSADGGDGGAGRETVAAPVPAAPAPAPVPAPAPGPAAASAPAAPAPSAPGDATASWQARTEDAPAPKDAEPGDAEPADAAPAAAGDGDSFENRMRRAIGEPEPQRVNRPAPAPAPPPPAEAQPQAKRPKPDDTGIGLFDWLTR